MDEQTPPNNEPPNETALVRTLLRDVPADGRRSLLLWAEELRDIRESGLSVSRKAHRALGATARSEVARPLVGAIALNARALGISTKRLLWDDRRLIGRLALGGAALGVVTLGGHSAGVAALGGAIGVPLWVVFGAGGAFLGAIIEELKPKPPTTTYTVIDAKKTDQDDL